MTQGMNLGAIFYYNAEPVYVDLMKQSGGAFNIAGTAFAALDANGWPNEDFIFGSTQRLPPDSPGNQSLTMLVDGNPGSVAMTLSNGWVLGATNYVPGTDTATIALTSPPDAGQNFEGPRLRFTGTKKTPASAVGSGVRRIRLPRPGYASTPDQLVTNEFIAQTAPFQVLRFMKATGAENNTTITNFAQYPRRTSFGMFGTDPNNGPQLAGMGIMPLEDIVDISNATGCSPWFTITGNSDGTLGVASLEYGISAYVDAHLRADLFANYEYANETWNYGAYQWFSYGVNKVMEEIHGFWNDAVADRGLRKLLSAVRTSNVVTCTMNVAHGMTTGQTISCYIAGNAGGTVTVIDATRFSFPYAGTNGALDLTSAGGGILGLSVITYDGNCYPSQALAERWFDRRKMQMSDNIRLAVGSAKMFSRHRPVYMSQMANGSLYRFDDGKAMLAQLGTTYAAKFSAIGGGGYNYGGNPDGFRITNDYSRAYTKDDYITAYLAWASGPAFSNGPALRYHTVDAFKAFALREGVGFYCYELGTDTKLYAFGDLTNYAANAAQMRAATLDTRWTAVEQNWVIDQSRNGIDIGIQFNMEMIAQGTVDGSGYWAMSYSPTIVSAKQQAFINFAASPPAYIRNVAPGVMDGRGSIGRYDLTGAFPTMHLIATITPLPTDRIIYLVNASATGTMVLTIDFKTLIATAHTITVRRNGALIGTVSIPSAGVGLLGTTLPISVPMVLGSQNAIELVRDNDNADFEIRSLHFV